MKVLKFVLLAGAWIQLSLVPAAGLDRSASLPSSPLDDDWSPHADSASRLGSPPCALDAWSAPQRSTYVEVPGASSSTTDKEGRGLLAQGWGRRCYTSYGWCWLPGPAPVGYPCYCCCPVVYGFVDF